MVSVRLRQLSAAFCRPGRAKHLKSAQHRANAQHYLSGTCNARGSGANPVVTTASDCRSCLRPSAITTLRAVSGEFQSGIWRRERRRFCPNSCCRSMASTAIIVARPTNSAMRRGIRCRSRASRSPAVYAGAIASTSRHSSFSNRRRGARQKSPCRYRRRCSFLPAATRSAAPLIPIWNCCGAITARHLVDVANAIARSVTHPVAYVHLPVPLTRATDDFFAPMGDFALSPSTEIYLGLIHGANGIEGAKERITLAHNYLSAFGIATECGFARAQAGSRPQSARDPCSGGRRASVMRRHAGS